MSYAEKLQEFGDKLLSKIKTDLTVDGDFSPTLVVFHNEATEHETIDLPLVSDDDESRAASFEQMESVSKLLKDKAKIESVDAQVMVIRGCIMELDEGEEEPTGDLKDHPDASEVIHLTVHLKDGTTLAHPILFSRDDSGSVSFMDMGWDSVSDASEGLTNPWK